MPLRASNRSSRPVCAVSDRSTTGFHFPSRRKTVGDKAIRIGLIGFGTIGTGVVKLLQRQRSHIRDRLGVALDLVRIADIDTRRDRGVKLARGLLVGDARRILDDPTIDVVIELMGGTGIARRFVLEAHRRAARTWSPPTRRCSRCTATRSSRPPRSRASRSASRPASAAASRSSARCKEGLCGDRNQAVFGIVNGTSNFILSTMSDAGRRVRRRPARTPRPTAWRRPIRRSTSTASTRPTS